jgi:hypothetical protein
MRNLANLDVGIGDGKTLLPSTIRGAPKGT